MFMLFKTREHLRYIGPIDLSFRSLIQSPYFSLAYALKLVNLTIGVILMMTYVLM
jgi:hypothetical protein